MDQGTKRPIVTLTTDFGTDSPYVAQMKGVILSQNPAAHVIDICHSIRPQDIQGGAIVLADVCHRFPPGTIHIAVVDPGVGTDRRIVCATIQHQLFVAPDNGLLALVARREPPVQVIAVTNRSCFLKDVSHTFHGRDIMAPVAGHLSLGLEPSRLGEPLDTLVTLPIPIPLVESRRIRGEIIQVDSFGNLVTNIGLEHLAGIPNPETAMIQSGGRSVSGLVNTYACRAAGTFVALVGSSGRLELALVNGNAAKEAGLNVGDEVKVAW